MAGARASRGEVHRSVSAGKSGTRARENHRHASASHLPSFQLCNHANWRAGRARRRSPARSSIGKNARIATAQPRSIGKRGVRAAGIERAGNFAGRRATISRAIINAIVVVGRRRSFRPASTSEKMTTNGRRSPSSSDPCPLRDRPHIYVSIGVALGRAAIVGPPVAVNNCQIILGGGYGRAFTFSLGELGLSGVRGGRCGQLPVCQRRRAPDNARHSAHSSPVSRPGDATIGPAAACQAACAAPDADRSAHEAIRDRQRRGGREGGVRFVWSAAAETKTARSRSAAVAALRFSNTRSHLRGEAGRGSCEVISRMALLCSALLAQPSPSSSADV